MPEDGKGCLDSILKVVVVVVVIADVLLSTPPIGVIAVIPDNAPSPPPPGFSVIEFNDRERVRGVMGGVTVMGWVEVMVKGGEVKVMGGRWWW